jgi:ATP-dependent DNA helicase RecG
MGRDAEVTSALQAILEGRPSADLESQTLDLRPPLTVDIQEHSFTGARLLLLFVPQSPEIHSDPQGRAPRRISTDCIPMEPSEQMRLREERLGIDWSAQRSERAVGDILPTALHAARERLDSFRDERRKLARLSDGDVLRALGVISADGALSCSPSSG